VLQVAFDDRVEWYAEFGKSIDVCEAWLPAASNFSTARQCRNYNIGVMAAPSIQTTAIPRFLLPQLRRSTTAWRPAAQGAAEARRHGSCCATSERRIPPSKLTPLQTQVTRQWGQRWPQHTTGYGSALELQRCFSATARQAKDHHFDTLKFVQRLKEEGFTEEQAEGMMRVLSDVIEERSVSHAWTKVNLGPTDFG
jgi:hypothetical protein